MVSLSEKILSADEMTSGDMCSINTFIDEKVMSLLCARLFDNEVYFKSEMKFNSNTFRTGMYPYDEDDVSEDSLSDVSYGGYLDRYVMCSYYSLYEKIRDDFAQTIGADFAIQIPVFSEVLREHIATGGDQEDSFKLFHSEFPDLTLHCLQNTDMPKEKAERISKALHNALPALEEYICNYFQWDPEFETFSLHIWVYRSEAIGKFLTEKPKGKKADRLRKAIEGLSFLKTGMHEGVWYGAEWIGYTFDSYEEYCPTSAITTHDIANMQIVMELLPYFIEKFNKKERKA